MINMETMTTKIEEKARLAYWRQKTRKVYGLGSFTIGYKEGFIAALNEVNQCITYLPNNKERLTAILKLIEEYDKD